MLELKKLSVTLTGILLVVYMFCLKLAVLCSFANPQKLDEES